MSENIGELELGVHADATALTPEVKAAAAKASRSAEINIPVKTDRSALDRVSRSVQDVNRKNIKSFGELNFSLAKVGATVFGVAGTFTDYGTILKGTSAAVVGVVASAGEAVTSIASFAGIVGSLGTAFATFKVATLGVSDALGAVSTAQQELAQTGDISAETLQKQRVAMQGLAPSARDFAHAFGEVTPQFRTFQQAVQGTFFRGLGDSLRTLAVAVLPSLQDGFTGIAQILNQAARAVADFVSRGVQSGALTDVFASFRRVLIEVLVAAANVGKGLLVIFDGLLPSGERLATAIGNIGARFETWAQGIVASGDLAEFMDKAQDAAGGLLELVGNLGLVLADVLLAGDDAGRSLTQTLADLVGRLHDFLTSAEGENALGRFFDSISESGKALQVVFAVLEPAVQAALAGFHELTAAIGESREQLIPVAEVIGVQLAPAVSEVAGVLSQLVTAFGDLVGALPPSFVATLVSLFAAFKLGAVAMELAGGAGKRLAGATASVKAFGVASLTAGRQAETGSVGLLAFGRNAVVAGGQIKGLGRVLGSAALAGGFLAMTAGAETGNKTLSTLGTTLTGAAFGASIGAAFGGVGAPIGAAVGAIGGFVLGMTQAKEATDEFEASVTVLQGTLNQTTGAVTHTTLEQVATDLDTVNSGIGDFTALDLAGKLGVPLDVATRAAAGFGDAQAQVAEHLNAAKIAAQQNIDILASQGQSTTEAAQAAFILDERSKALLSSLGIEASTIEEAQANLDQHKEALAGTAITTDGLKSAIDRLNPSLAEESAQIQAVASAALQISDRTLSFEEAVFNLNKALKEAPEHIKRNTQAYFDLQHQVNTTAGGFQQLGPAQQRVSSNIERSITPIIRAEIAMGKGAKTATDYAKRLLGIPPDVKVKYNEDGSVTVLGAAANIKDALKDLDNDSANPKITVDTGQAAGAIAGIQAGLSGLHDKSITVTTTTLERHLITEHATGGVIRHPEIALIGEAGPELIVPLRPNAPLAPGVENALLTLADQRRGAGDPAPVHITVNMPTDDPEAAAMAVLNRLAVAGVV